MQSTLIKKDKQKAKSSDSRGGSPVELKRWSPLIVLSVFWLLCLSFVGIGGNFPINDDWIYAESVQHFLNTGHLRLLACAPACLFQIISAAAVCKVFGFSHEILRCYGFFCAVLASFALYGCCRQLGANRNASLLLTLCFAANPLFICLAFSFMTDMPAIALSIAYSYFLLHGLRQQRSSSLILSSVCLIAATCVRQNLGFMAAINLCILLCMWLRRKHSWSMLLGLVIAPLAVGFAADKWMLSSNDFTSLYVWYKGMVGKQILQLLHAPSRVIPGLLQIAGELLCYMGIFSLPVLVCFLPAFSKLFRNKSKINPAIPVSSAALIVFSLCRFVIGENRWMPFSQNLLRIPELGAHTLLGINHAALTARWKQNLTWLGGMSGFLLGTLLIDTIVITVVSLWRSFKSASGAKLNRALLAIAAISIFMFQFAFTTLQSTFSDIDRYYLFPFMGAIFCLALAWRWHKARVSMFLALPLLLAITTYSFAATQDMMAWNRARWSGLQKLEASGVDFHKIDGGAEYNYARDPQLFKNLILHETWYEFTHRGEPPRDQWRWWTVAGEDYIISFSPVPGYDIVSKEKYWSALSGNREILVLKKL